MWRLGAVGCVLGGPDLQELQLDGSVVKTHQHASGSRRKAGKKENADARRCISRFRRGFTTKIHAAVDAVGRLVRLCLTAGQCGESPQAAVLMESSKPQHVLADAAYGSNAIRKQIKKMGAKCCIRPNRTRKVRKRYDKQRYKHHNLIERFFCRIKNYCRVATRHDKKPENYAGFVWLASLMTSLK